MKALILVSMLAVGLSGLLTTSAEAQASGPLCLQIVEFDEVAQFFALPTGGGQLILTGENLTFGDAYSGSGYVLGGDFVFSLVSGILPGLLEGIISLSTGQGFGSINFTDTGSIETVTYVFFSPPCAP